MKYLVEMTETANKSNFKTLVLLVLLGLEPQIQCHMKDKYLGNNSQDNEYCNFTKKVLIISKNALIIRQNTTLFELQNLNHLQNYNFINRFILSIIIYYKRYIYGKIWVSVWMYL